MIIDKNFKEFIQLLNKNRVKYLIVGGYAVALHGHPRYTKDLDIWIYVNTNNVERLINTLNEFGFSSLDLESNDFMTFGNVVQLGSTPNRIDLLTSVDGVEFESCYESKIEVDRAIKKSGGHRGIKKIAPVIALVVPPNSGKTTVFKNWTGEGTPHNYPNSTQQPETAMALYKEARLQVVDTPSFDGSYGHNADVVIICGPDHSIGKQFKRQIVLIADKYHSNDEILEAAWKALKLIRVFTPDGKYPMLAKKGSSVSDVAKKIHKSFVDNFEWAKIKRGRRIIRVGLDFIVKAGDLLILRSRIG